MANLYAAFRTSEFWVALVSAIVSVLVTNGVLDKGTADLVNMGFVYVIGRLVSKAAKATFPDGGSK
mgnify:CR=1 FL=1